MPFVVKLQIVCDGQFTDYAHAVDAFDKFGCQCDVHVAVSVAPCFDALVGKCLT